MSGFCRTNPPVELKFPGVMAVPPELKKSLRGPSDVNVSKALVPLKGPGKGPAGPEPPATAAGAAGTIDMTQFVG